MAFQSTTGLGTPTQISCTGNNTTPNRTNSIDLSLTNTTYPSTFQLNPAVQDAGGNSLTLGTAFTIASVASALPVPYVLTAASATSTTTAGVIYSVYTGTVTGGGSNAYAGRQFIVSGFAASSGANNGQFQCIASTVTTLNLTNSNGIAETHAGSAQDQTSSAVYTGTITGGGSNAFADQAFVVAGFVTTPANNGTYFATASSATTLTLDNPNAVAETHAATATGEDPIAFTYLTTNAGYVTVAATGLMTAVKAGESIIEISYPVFSNTAGNIVSSGNVMNGTPTAKIYREMNVHVKA